VDLMRGCRASITEDAGILGSNRDLAPVIDAGANGCIPTISRRHPADRPGLIDVGLTVTYRIRDARGRYRSILERGLIQRNSSAIRCAPSAAVST